MKNCLPSKPTGNNPSTGVAGIVDHLFRRESGRLVAILIRRLGAENLHLAEDVVQDALVKAMQTWPFTGVPVNPTAWILQTARNRAFDQTRRNTIWRGKKKTLLPLVEDCLESALRTRPPQFEDEIQDSQLRMMFVCCHPRLPVEAQVALTLKVLCGFGEREIAAAFLATEPAIAKRLTRARQFLRDEHVTVDLPPAGELTARISGVQQALYLLFNEGYKASHGPALLREELCAEAIRLGELLVAQLGTDGAPTHALLALMYFGMARLPARVDAAGDILTLPEQDRGRWDRKKIQRGVVHLAASGGGVVVSRYHLEAGIAACHTLAASDRETNWREILGFYDELLARDSSPIVALNRAVALARISGPVAGLRAVETMVGRATLEHYHLLHAVLGQFWLDAGEHAKAAAAFRQASELAILAAERDLLCRRAAEAMRGV